MRETFLFHTMLNELVPGADWRDDHTLRITAANLQAEGHTATMEWVWPVGENGQSLDCLGEDCRQMVNRVLDTFNRQVASGRVKTVSCYMAPRKPEKVVCDPGWLEWGVYLRDEENRGLLYIAHIQRQIGADVERHT